MLKGQRIVVSGGAGFIGSNLVASLASCNEVVVVDDLSSGVEENLPLGVEVIIGDILDPCILDRAFRDRTHLVFHFAALFANQNSVDHPEQDLQVNGLGTLRMLERARHAHVERFVYASSSCVYGPRSGACNEDDVDFHPETPYAFTKLLGEQYTYFFHRTYGLPTVVIRYFNVYGPGERPGPYRNVIPNFFARAQDGQSLVITGDGTETRDFTFVTDAVAGTLAAAACAVANGHVYNIGSGVETQIVSLAEEINRVTGNMGGIDFQRRRYWDGVQRRSASIEKAASAFGYKPKVLLRQGLEETWRWLNAQVTPGPSRSSR